MEVISKRELRHGAGLLCDQQIMHLCHETGMIEPFVAEQVRHVYRDGEPVHWAFANNLTEADHTTGSVRRVVSFGLSSYGYDLRAGDEWLVFDSMAMGVVDPKQFDDELLRPARVVQGEHGRYITMPGNSYALGASLEHFNMPPDVLGVAVGKSTYARCGVLVNVTPLEPGWRGHLTIEVSNASPRPARIYLGEGLLQVQFWRGVPPLTTYADRAGKYQDQPNEPVTARL